MTTTGRLHYHEVDEHDNVGGFLLVLQPCEDSPCLRAGPHLYICPSPAMHFPARDTVILDWNDDDEIRDFARRKEQLLDEIRSPDA